jgi:hypothetical protein
LAVRPGQHVPFKRIERTASGIAKIPTHAALCLNPAQLKEAGFT